jgi:hypothetical protein
MNFRTIPSFFLWMPFFFVACFEPKEGCLDIAATNFDVAADKDCCCEYPKLVLRVEQVYGDAVFLNNAAYLGDGGHLFRINSVVFYLSDFRLFQDGKSYTVSDTLRLRTYVGSDSSSTLFTNDFLLVRRSPLDYVVGTFRQDGYFERVQFRLGLTDDAHRVLPSKAPANHPLAVQSENLWLGNSAGFSGLQAVVSRDTLSGTVPDTLRFSQAELGQALWQANGNFFHPSGYNFDLILKADYQKLFEGVNFGAHDVAAWKARMVANLPNVFNLSQ